MILSILIISAFSSAKADVELRVLIANMPTASKLVAKLKMCFTRINTDLTFKICKVIACNFVAYICLEFHLSLDSLEYHGVIS